MLSFLTALLLLPSLSRHHAPSVFFARCETTAGGFTIEVHRDWAPYGADRFYELVRGGYYNDSRFFRVVTGKWAQFGISGDPTVAQRWRNRTIPDDPLKQHNTRSFVAFSNTGPGTRSTQVYINTGDNSAVNDREEAFAPFGQVVSGMDVVDHLYAGYGEHSGSGMRAGHQDDLFLKGNPYLDANFPRLDKLIRLSIDPGKGGQQGETGR